MCWSVGIFLWRSVMRMMQESLAERGRYSGALPKKFFVGHGYKKASMPQQGGFSRVLQRKFS